MMQKFLHRVTDQMMRQLCGQARLEASDKIRSLKSFSGILDIDCVGVEAWLSSIDRSEAT